ncbi:hypothetical protein [Rhodopirellula sp. MGV]|uniref:hypothetical protein n=1 Tax=Rhodopirellula sp. MGV TaxID=2023130 RepID=UPI00117B59B5|nr:hypothetical protein [Rhodopirellula sp. MGV]
MTKLILQRANWALLFAVALMVSQSPTAEAGKLFSQTGASCHCPVCDHCCELKAEQVDVEKTCFKVESKLICIPRVVFPWQKSKQAACAACDSCDGQGCTNCVHNGARVRKVCVLKTEKYTCPACEYSWTPVKKDVCCGDGCDGGCTGGPAETGAPVEMIETEPGQPSIVAPPAAAHLNQPIAEPISAADYFRIPAPVVSRQPSVSRLPIAPVR